MEFSQKEIKEIGIALVVLTFIFAYPEVLSEPFFFLLSLLSVGIGFIGHELSHKYVARRYGFFAEFRMWKEGILLALFMGILSGGVFIFAAPGAVVFGAKFVFQKVSKAQLGKIGIAGVIFNLIMYGVFFALFMITGNGFFLFAATINSWLALFNLIPFAILDGQKVFAWNKGIWAVTFILSVLGTFVLPGLV